MTPLSDLPPRGPKRNDARDTENPDLAHLLQALAHRPSSEALEAVPPQHTGPQFSASQLLFLALVVLGVTAGVPFPGHVTGL